MKKVILSFLIFVFSFGLSPAKIYVNIKSPGFTKIGVGVRFTGDRDEVLESVFKRDLIMYGIFRIYPLDLISLSLSDLKVIGADLFVRSEVRKSDGKIEVLLSVFDTSDQKEVLSKIFEGPIGATVLVAHKMADSLYKLATGNDGMFAKPAVAVRKVAGGYELCLLDVGAGRFKRVLFSNRPIQAPALSPDGGKIAFSLMRKGNFDLYVLDIRTGKYEKICSTPGPDTSPSWSPDGSKIVFSGTVGDNTDLYLCDLKTQKLTRLTYSIGIETSPSFSPDGRKIVFVSSRAGRPNIYIMDLDTKRTTRISFGYYDVSPEWSPSGDSIVYATIFEGNYLVKIYYVDNGVTDVVAPGEDPTWSPNGDYVLFVRFGGLFLKSIYGSDEVKIFSGRWENPFWR